MRGVTRIAQDVGIALLLGGNVFGRRAMHPAVEWISSPAERGKVVNEAWRRYGLFNSLGLAGVVSGWALERRSSPDALRGAAVGPPALTRGAAAIEGARFARSPPPGAGAPQAGHRPSAQGPPPA